MAQFKFTVAAAFGNEHDVLDVAAPTQDAAVDVFYQRLRNQGFVPWAPEALQITQRPEHVSVAPKDWCPNRFRHNGEVTYEG